MKKTSRHLKDATQKKITVLFCSFIAIVMIFSVMFSTINAQAAPAQITNKYYTSIQIQSGDTLWAIASEYITDDYTDMNEYMNEICSINHISRDEIKAGKYLVVPYYAVQAIDE